MSAIFLSFVDIMHLSIYFDLFASIIDHAISGLSSNSKIFLFGSPLLPLLAGIIAKMSPQKAREVTVELRRLRNLPQVGG